MNEEARNKIKGLIATARENPYTFDRMQRIMSGQEQPVGDHYSIHLDFGYRIVYSIEQHPLKDGTGYQWVHHLSISVSKENDKWHNPAACNWILNEFGMPSIESHQCMMWLENEHDDTMPSAVNLLAEYEGEP
jgi:hypothetical protein